jgi:hypothetical protein
MPENFRYISNGDLVEHEHDADTIHKFLKMHRRIENPDAYSQLQNDLIEHHWVSMVGVVMFFLHLFGLKQFI